MSQKRLMAFAGTALVVAVVVALIFRVSAIKSIVTGTP
jgi:hypothetical protein